MSKGFTLIELLIVILIIGIIIAAVLVGIDPVDKINSANDAKVQTDIETLASAFENNAIAFGAIYSSNPSFLLSTGELRSLPIPPSGYCSGAYQFGPGGPSQFVWCNLKSKKYAATPYWYWCSATGATSAVASIPATCP